VAVIVLSALLYPFGLVALPDGSRLTYPSAPVEFASVLGESLYFSAVTFATGATGYDPVGLGRILAAFEGFAGILVFALLVYAFARRATQ
jgi:hypothetical protein